MDQPLKAPINDWTIEPDHEESGVLKGHYYRVSGDGWTAGKCPSVTTIQNLLNKPMLLPWVASQMEKKATELFARKVGPDGNLHIPFSEAQDILSLSKKQYRNTSEAALDIGSSIHDLIERHLLGEDVSLALVGAPTGVQEGFKAFETWAKNHEVKPERVEVRIASKKHRFGGTIDFLGYIDGVLTMLDFKSSKAIYDEYYDQVSAYMAAYEEMTGKKIEQGALVRFDKVTGEMNEAKDYKVFPRAEAVKRFKSFKHLVAYWHEKNG